MRDNLGQSAVALTDVIFFLNFVPGYDQAHRALDAIIETLVILGRLATNCCSRTEDAASSARSADDTILLLTTRSTADAKMRGSPGGASVDAEGGWGLRCERHARSGSRRHQMLRLLSVSAGGVITPEFWMVSRMTIA